MIQEANHDVKLQNDQIDNMVDARREGPDRHRGRWRCGRCTARWTRRLQAGVKVIAYDRLIKSTNISAYISFNNTEVGRQEALGVVNDRSGHLKAGTTWTKDNPRQADEDPAVQPHRQQRQSWCAKARMEVHPTRGSIQGPDQGRGPISGVDNWDAAECAEDHGERADGARTTRSMPSWRRTTVRRLGELCRP